MAECAIGSKTGPKNPSAMTAVTVVSVSDGRSQQQHFPRGCVELQKSATSKAKWHDQTEWSKHDSQKILPTSTGATLVMGPLPRSPDDDGPLATEPVPVLFQITDSEHRKSNSL